VLESAVTVSAAEPSSLTEITQCGRAKWACWSVSIRRSDLLVNGLQKAADLWLGERHRCLYSALGCTPFAETNLPHPIAIDLGEGNDYVILITYVTQHSPYSDLESVSELLSRKMSIFQLIHLIGPRGQ
jgi:hypothetical protein